MQSSKLTYAKCIDMYGNYSESEFEYARSIDGNNPPLAETCYQAFTADPDSLFNAEFYIGIYNG